MKHSLGSTTSARHACFTLTERLGSRPRNQHTRLAKDKKSSVHPVTHVLIQTCPVSVLLCTRRRPVLVETTLHCAMKHYLAALGCRLQCAPQHHPAALTIEA